MTDGLLSRGSANGRQRVAHVSGNGGVQAMRLLIAFDPLRSAGPSESGHKGDTAEADALGSPLEANWAVAPSGGFWAVREVRERPYMDPSSFASTPIFGGEVRLRTYIRPLTAAFDLTDAGP